MGAIALAHGILASLAWIIIFPFGAVLIRNLKKNCFKAHVYVQVPGMIIFIASVALGAYVATKADEWVTWNGHAILGMVILGVCLLLPVMGTLHHKLFKSQRVTTIWAVVHVWIGRIIITAAIINGALGVQLSNSDHYTRFWKGELVYGLVGGLAWFTYVALQIRHAVRNGGDVKMGRKFDEEIPIAHEKVRKESDSSDASSQDVAAWTIQNRDMYEHRVEADGGHRSETSVV